MSLVLKGIKGIERELSVWDLMTMSDLLMSLGEDTSGLKNRDGQGVDEETAKRWGRVIEGSLSELRLLRVPAAGEEGGYAYKILAPAAMLDLGLGDEVIESSLFGSYRKKVLDYIDFFSYSGGFRF